MMNEREYLEYLTGDRWTGIRFVAAPQEKIQPFSLLCEAVSCSFERDIVMDAADVTCPGACHCLGLERDEERMAHRMSERAGITAGHAVRIIGGTPRLETGIAALALGRIDHPDVLVSFLTPKAAMCVLRRWQRFSGTRLTTSFSAFAALCAALAAAHTGNEPVFSFGCPDSRAYGGITDDRLIAAMPGGLAVMLAREDGWCVGKPSLPEDGTGKETIS